MARIIVPVVEGVGDVESVRVLFRRIISALAAHEAVSVRDRAIRIPKGRLLKKEFLQNVVRLAALEPGSFAVVFLLDADSDCPKELAPQLLSYAREAMTDMIESVVFANSEFESWFIASIESLRGRFGIPHDICMPLDPEAIRDAKGWLAQHRSSGRYKEVIDQPLFAKEFNLGLARHNSPSFDKLMREMESIIGRAQRRADAGARGAPKALPRG